MNPVLKAEHPKSPARREISLDEEEGAVYVQEFGLSSCCLSCQNALVNIMKGLCEILWEGMRKEWCTFQVVENDWTKVLMASTGRSTWAFVPILRIIVKGQEGVVDPVDVAAPPGFPEAARVHSICWKGHCSPSVLFTMSTSKYSCDSRRLSTRNLIFQLLNSVLYGPPSNERYVQNDQNVW